MVQVLHDLVRNYQLYHHIRNSAHIFEGQLYLTKGRTFQVTHTGYFEILSWAHNMDS